MMHAPTWSHSSALRMSSNVRRSVRIIPELVDHVAVNVDDHVNVDDDVNANVI
jgi:hypothetical protein